MRSHMDLSNLLLLQYVMDFSSIKKRRSRIKKSNFVKEKSAFGTKDCASMSAGHVHVNDGKRVFITDDSQHHYFVNKNSEYKHTGQQQQIHHQYNLGSEVQQHQQQHNLNQHMQQQHEPQQRQPIGSRTQATNEYRNGIVDSPGRFRNPGFMVNALGFSIFNPANMADVVMQQNTQRFNPSGGSNTENNYQGFSGTPYDNVKSGQTNFETDNSMAGSNRDGAFSLAGNLVGSTCTRNWQSCRRQCVRIDPNSGCAICTCELQTTVYNTQSSTSVEPEYRRPVNERLNQPPGVASHRTGYIANPPDVPKTDDKENLTCPDYLQDCLPDCINFDSRGCLVCRCDFITCRPFSRTCPREFSKLDQSGCPVCMIL